MTSTHPDLPRLRELLSRATPQLLDGSASVDVFEQMLRDGYAAQRPRAKIEANFAEDAALIVEGLPMLPAILSALAQGEDDPDEAYQLGLRDGESAAVQKIDELTGGDGEYRFCTNKDPERHCPDPEAMVAKIVERFNELSATPAEPPTPAQGASTDLCSDCPPVGYPTDKTRCLPCPRRMDGPAPSPTQGGVEVTDEQAAKALWTELSDAPNDWSQLSEAEREIMIRHLARHRLSQPVESGGVSRQWCRMCHTTRSVECTRSGCPMADELQAPSAPTTDVGGLVSALNQAVDRYDNDWARYADMTRKCMMTAATTLAAMEQRERGLVEALTNAKYGFEFWDREVHVAGRMSGDPMRWSEEPAERGRREIARIEALLAGGTDV